MIDPNIIYLVLLASLWLIVTAIHVPGTGALEGLAVIGAIAALGLMAASPINWAAAIVVVLGTLSALVVPFFGREYELVAMGGLMVAAGAALLLFNGAAVSPAIIVLVTGTGLVFQRFALMPAIDRQKTQPAMLDDQPIIGARGYVQRALTPVGTVYVRGESWTARAMDAESVETGAEIVVIDREGLTLVVEVVKHKRTEETADTAL